jgi:hypothetical protein
VPVRLFIRQVMPPTTLYYYLFGLSSNFVHSNMCGRKSDIRMRDVAQPKQNEEPIVQPEAIINKDEE